MTQIHYHYHQLHCPFHLLSIELRTHYLTSIFEYHITVLGNQLNIIYLRKYKLLNTTNNGLVSFMNAIVIDVYSLVVAMINAKLVGINLSLLLQNSYIIHNNIHIVFLIKRTFRIWINDFATQQQSYQSVLIFSRPTLNVYLYKNWMCKLQLFKLS